MLFRSHFTATSELKQIEITSWNLENLMITAPTDFIGTFDLSIAAHATESGTHEIASYSLPLTVTVIDANVSSPIVFDLNGDGIQTTALKQSNGKFDLLNTGKAIHSGWLSAEDGFLAMDHNANGIIDDRSELFGGAIGEGFAKLRALDDNHDGVIDKKDTAFDELKIWQDKNSNHQTDAGELFNLHEYDIASINLDYTIEPVQQHGNWLLEQTTATKGDGTSIAMADAYFEIPQNEVANLISKEKPDTQKREAKIIIQSLPEKVREVVHSLLAMSPIFTSASDYKSDAIPNTEQGAMPLISWNSASDDEKDKDKTASEQSKKNTSWLSSFLGIDSEKEPADLSETTGLKIKIQAKGDNDK